MMLMRMVERQFYIVIKEIQTNIGWEFLFLTYKLQFKGLLHRVICSHAFEQNGMVESCHKCVMEKGLTLFFQETLPISICIHAFRTNIFTINRLPFKVLNSQSPYQLFMEKYHTMVS